MLWTVMWYRAVSVNHALLIKHPYCPESHYVGGGLGMNTSWPRMYFSEALSSTSNELQQVSSGRSLNELQARSARSKRKEIELDESLLCASRRGLSSDLLSAPLTKRMGNPTLVGSCLSYESLLDSVIWLYKFRALRGFEWVSAWLWHSVLYLWC